MATIVDELKFGNLAKIVYAIKVLLENLFVEIMSMLCGIKQLLYKDSEPNENFLEFIIVPL